MLRHVLIRTIAACLSLLLLLTLVGGLLWGSEHFLRYVYRDITTTGDGGSWLTHQWFLKELGRGLVKLNTLNFRDTEPVMPKPQNRLRVVVLGDSFTFGQGVDESTRYTNVINSQFDAESTAIDLINFGKSGSDVRQYVGWIDRASSLEPDYILIQWLPNDFEIETKTQTIQRPTPGNLFPQRFREYHFHFHRHSVLYFLLNRGWHRVQGLFSRTDSYVDYMWQRFGDPGNPDAKHAIDYFNRLIDTWQSNDIGIGMIMFPFLEYGLGSDDYAFDYLHDRMMAFCEEQKIPCLDLRNAFGSVANDIASLHVNQFDSHPSPLAHKIAAKTIKAFFLPIWRTELVTQDN